MKLQQSKKLIDELLSYIITISELSEILEVCGVTAEQYDNALGCVEKRSLYYINQSHVK